MRTLAIVIRNRAQLSAALRRFRKLERRTQGMVGDSAGLPQTTVSKIEVGSIDPSLSTLFRVLAALDLELVLRPRGRG